MQAHAGRRLAVLGVSVIALMAIPTLSAAQSGVALSCAGVTPQERFDNADVVFSGTVISERVKRVAHYSPDGEAVSYSSVTTYRIKRDRVFKGYVRSPQRVQADAYGPTPFRLRGEGPFLFYARRPTPAQSAKFKERGTRPPVYTGACGGTRRLGHGDAPPFDDGRSAG